MAGIDILKDVGERFSSVMTKLIQSLSELGLNISETGGKILSLLIVLSITYTIFKVVERPIKYIILLLLVALALSIFTTLLP